MLTEDEDAILKFYHHDRLTRSFYLEEKAKEVKGMRDLLCSRTKGDSPLDCVLDLEAHGVWNVDQAEEHLRKKPVVALEALPSYTKRYLNEKRSVDFTDSINIEPEGDRRLEMVIVVLVALFAVFFYVYYFWRDPEIASSLWTCSKVARSNIAFATSSLRRDLKQRKINDEEHLASQLEHFAEGVSHNWRLDSEENFPPKHALTLRVSGDSHQAMSDVVEKFVKEWLGSHCMYTKSLSIHVDVDGKDLKGRINKFLKQAKANHDEEISVIILTGLDTTAANKRIASLKNHLEDNKIQVGETQQVSSHGVGFILIGATLQPGQTCHSADPAIADKSLGWEKYLLNRISQRAKFCHLLA